MPKITIVLIAFVAALIWVFLLGGGIRMAKDSSVTTEQVEQATLSEQ